MTCEGVFQTTMNMKRILTVIVSLVFSLSLSADNWPQWRGPEGTGVSRERDLPINWNSQRGILWKAELPEWGDSTPAIWGDAIFITSHHDDKLLLLRLDKANKGKIVWTQTVGTGSAR